MILFLMRLIRIRRCHLGRVILYDTVTERGWAVDIRTHGIQGIIDKVLNEDWIPPSEDGEGVEVPEAEEEKDCLVSTAS
jgi:lipase ATG15